MINQTISLIITLLAIPVGYLIAYLARDELIDGRKWFRIIIIASLVLGILFYALGKNEIVLTLSFIAIVSLISLIKGNDKKWTKKRI